MLVILRVSLAKILSISQNKRKTKKKREIQYCELKYCIKPADKKRYKFDLV